MSGTTPSYTVPSSITQEGICNLALGHLKITHQIANLTTDQSPEAVACRTFYNIVKQQMLEDFKWPFATKQAALALIEGNPFAYDSSGNSEWAYAYEYPADAVNFVRILSGLRNESRLDRVPFRIFNNPIDQAKMILTDMECAFGEWTTNVLPEDMFSAAYAMALSLILAHMIAPMVTGGDPFKLGDRAMKLYGERLIKAQGNALNEEQIDIEPESEFVQARGYRSYPWSRGGWLR